VKDSNYGKSKKTGDYYGKVFLSNSCGYYQITLANSTDRMRAVFLQTNTTLTVTASQVDSGGVVDPYYPSMRGVGYHGEAETTIDESGKQLKEYVYWYGMIDRCYGNRELESYKDCIVSEEFHDFSYFQKWFHKQVGRYSKDFQLDKDILSEDCKIYAEDTCVLVPSEINMFFAKTGGRTHSNFKDTSYPVGVSWYNGMRKFKASYNNGGEKHETYHDNEWSAFLAYKQAKENRAKELAEKWRGQIDNRVYEKLINYKVLLTD
jgi:hypothetical protein